MAEQWEMCRTNWDSVVLYTPEKLEFLDHKSFIQRFEAQFNMPQKAFGDYGIGTSICLLLANGWEPFEAQGGINDWYCFRRKRQG